MLKRCVTELHQKEEGLFCLVTLMLHVGCIGTEQCGICEIVCDTKVHPFGLILASVAAGLIVLQPSK